MATKRKDAKKKQKRPKRDLAASRTSVEAHSSDPDMITIPEVLAVLPARDLVAFPSVMMSLYVGRPASVRAVEAAVNGPRVLLVLSQRNQQVEDPAVSDLCTVGVVAQVMRTLALPDGRIKVLLQGIMRARAADFKEDDRYLQARIEPIAPDAVRKLRKQDEEMIARIRGNIQVLVQHEHLPEEMLLVTEELNDPGLFADVVLAHYRIEPAYAQSLLEELDPLKRLKLLDSLIADDLNQFMLGERIRDKTRDELNKGQRDYYLREQIKQIQRELGEADVAGEDLVSLKANLEKIKMPAQAKAEADKQLKRLERMSTESSDYALLRTYLEWLCDVPWNERTTDQIDLKGARKILEEDHFGLEKVKQRVLEYLSVRKLRKDPRGPILCFVGPPGVGKTSLGKSIARALGRKFFRMSLGGVRDEAEIRGHRRTYVGALPGRIVQGLKQSGAINPVFVLDELDKLGADFRGDPSAALLEVLDPHQNQDFRDHYLGVGVDLSEVLFIATANTTDTIPDALLDRLEVIQIAGYTTEEKLSICQRFLIPRQLKEHGLENFRVKFDREATLFLVERYTREAGVRNLEREVGALCRKIAHEFTESNKRITHITSAGVQKLLGPTKFDPDEPEREESVGLVRGLAWTIHGGEMMPIEASIAKGTGQLNLTGQLGDVMQESAQAAMFYARANATKLGLDPEFHSKHDIHIHVPSGATPKDGPSAGITIATALVSALSQRKVSRHIAMTGEITLRGNVLAVGGLKEKALAALRHGVRTIIIPHENLKDVDEIPKEQRERITFMPVRHVSEVLEIALRGKPIVNSPAIKIGAVAQKGKVLIKRRRGKASVSV